MSTVHKVNLDEKTPEELKQLLDSVKVSNLPIQEKDMWIQRIQNKLGSVVRDPERERKILADIDAGKADTEDMGN